MNRKTIKQGSPLTVYGKVKQFNALTFAYDQVTDLTGWAISAKARAVSAEGLVVGVFTQTVTGQVDTYLLSLDTALIEANHIAVDIKVQPPGGLVGFTQTYEFFIEKAVTR